MTSEVKIYKIKDFIRKTPTGEIDLEQSIQIIHELAVAASFHADHNILIDMRKTTVAEQNTFSAVLRLALEMAKYKSVFRGKIATVVPSDEKRLSIAKQFKASLDMHGFTYEVFTSFEDAIDWLSDITNLRT